MHYRILLQACAAFLILSCTGREKTVTQENSLSSCFRTVLRGDTCTVITTAPDSSRTDSISVVGSMDRIVCMSSTYVAALSELGCDSTICGVSGIQYISSPEIRRRHDAGLVADVGSDANADFERILAVRPDIVVTYFMPGAGEKFISGLNSLGIPVLVLYDYLENSPLARASYIKVFGALCGKAEKADSIFGAVCARYRHVADSVSAAGAPVKKVLMNVPYADAWYVPGGENYMSRLVRDAGGEILGSAPGKTESSVISAEEALALSFDADVWLHTGVYESLEELHAVPSLSGIHVESVYNNTLKMTPGGGNDFWESGAVRPDLILGDLAGIFAGKSSGFHYYRKLE